MDKETALKKITTELEADFEKMLATPELKNFIEKTKAAADSGEFEVVISDESVDRMNEVIKMDGWELERYMMNPVVLWGHKSWEPPIGITTSLEKKDGKLIAKGKFAPAEASPLAQQVRRLYDLGIQRATSVGFIVKEQEGNIITRAELLEFSFVSVPANPMALSTLVKSDININEMVTKGFMFVKEAEEEDAPAEETPVEVPAEETPAAEAEPALEPEADADEPDLGINEDIDDEEKSFTVDRKEIVGAVSAIRSAVIALEDLVKSQEPEGNKTGDEVSDEDVKAYKEFSQKRKIIQDAATVLSEVLAEARVAIEASKK